MSRDDSRLAAVLAELAELGRRLSERAGELAGLVSDGSRGMPAGLADRVADVRASTADLAEAAAGVTAPASPESPPASAADGTAATTETTASTAARPTAPRHPAGRAARRRSASRRPVTPRASAAKAADRRPGTNAGGRRLRPLMPALVSAAVNVVAILGLALIFVAAEAKPKRAVLTLGGAEEPFVDEVTPVEVVATEEPAAAEPTAEPLPALEAFVPDPAAIEAVAAADAAFAADTAAVPVSFDAVAALAAGGGVGGAAAGGQGSGAAAGGRPGGGQPGGGSFFGRQGQGQRVCFLCDNSNSYRDGGFHAVLDELARAVDSLRPDQSFFVIFFSDAAYPLFHPDRVEGLQPASPENKERLRAWLATVELCGGGRGIDEAVRLAGGLDAEVIYFLSDGEHAASVVERVVSADFGGAVVHTFGMQQGVLDRRTGQVDPEKVRKQHDCDRNLVAIATGHGGTFTPVTVPPQAALLERLRPIRRNRTPGPVWGLKL